MTQALLHFRILATGSTKCWLEIQHLEFVPWLVEDVGRRMQYYVYSLKDATFQKGANRWSCSCFLLTDPVTRD